MLTLQHEPKFQMGMVVATPSALQSFAEEFLSRCLDRHSQCDWGDCCDDDKRENDLSLKQGGGVMSVYRDKNKSLWIITEADYSATTLLLPEEY